jgi:hypothetical protein
MIGAPSTCQADSDCTSGVNGRCIESPGGGARRCFCSYDTCVHDVDCPAGQACACHGTPYTGGAGNACVPGNCRVDADCGPRGYCSPSSAQVTGCSGLAGFFCHTPADECTDDSDCMGTTGPQLCAYWTTAKHWQCHTALLCP